MFFLRVDTNTFEIIKFSITQRTHSRDNQRKAMMNCSVMSFKVWPRFNNVIAKTTVEGFPFWVFTNNRYRLYIIRDICFVLLNAVNTQTSLRLGDKIAFFASKYFIRSVIVTVVRFIHCEKVSSITTDT